MRPNHWRLLAVVLVAVVSMTALVASAGALEYGETRVTSNGANQWDPQVYGNILVWTDYRHGASNAEIYRGAVGSTANIRASNAAGHDILAAPAPTFATWVNKYNHRAAMVPWGTTGSWMAPYPVTDVAASGSIAIIGINDQRLVAYNRANGSYSSLPPLHAADPAIYAPWVVYQDNRSGQWDIYAYNLNSHQERRITNETAHQADPEIFGNIVVWSDYRHGNWEIYAYNLANGYEARVTNNPTAQYNPTVTGSIVIWEDERTGGPYQTDLYLKDLNVGVERRFTTSLGQQDSPDAFGQFVTYADSRSGQWDIYTKRLFPTTMTLAGKGANASYDSTVTLTATLKLGSTPVGGRTVQFQKWNGATWATMTSRATDASGIAQVVTPKLQQTTTYRALFMGDVFLPSVKSVTQRVQANLTAPSVPRGGARLNVTFNSIGYLKPIHAAGSAGTKILAYRSERGIWVQRASFNALPSNYSTYSKYAAAVKLPSTGSWRLRAYHSDASHAPTYGPYTYVTVSP